MSESKHGKHYYIYLFGLSLMIIGLPFSKFLLSFSQMILGANWLLEGKYKEKIKRLLNNKAALAFCLIYILHLVGMLYTSDLQYGLKDLRIKIPLLIVPFIIASTQPISKGVLCKLLLLFSAAVIASTIISACVLFHTSTIGIHDVRSISIFISHIRLGLLICLSIFILSWFLFTQELTKNIKIVLAISILWLVVFLFLSESVTGIMILFACTICVSIYLVLKAKKKYTRVLSGIYLLCVLLFISGYLVRNIQFFYAHDTKELGPLDSLTSKGNPYLHQPNSRLKENGNIIYIYVCWQELEETWNKRSKIDFKENDKKGNLISQTLVRFLASKALRKDAEGVNTLSQPEVEEIENGIPNVNYKNLSSLDIRVNQIIWEFDNYLKGGNPSGNSVTQRIEYWKAAVNIIEQHPLLGVGTGDIKNIFIDYYNQTQSQLSEKWRLRSHNQFLSITIAFGFIGLLVFMFGILYPSFFAFRQGNYFYTVFFIIAMLSMITEDTIETQTGVTFFAFFSALLLFGIEKEPK